MRSISLSGKGLTSPACLRNTFLRYPPPPGAIVSAMLRPPLRAVFAGLLMELPWLGLYAITPLRDHPSEFLGLMLASFAGCCWCFRRLEIEGRSGAAILFGFALVFRFTVLSAPPDQSEDVYRYLWDARVAASGVSPFAYPPDADELRALRDSQIYPKLNSKPYVTAYPPVSQLLFRASYSLFGPKVTAMKAVFGILEFAALLLLWALSRRLGAPRVNLLLIAWNPFFIFEFWHSGHSDSGMVFLTLLAVFLLAASRGVPAMLSYSGAVLSKLHPALWYPVLWRKTRLTAQVACGLSLAGLLAIYFDLPSLWRYVSSLRLYYRLFEFNASIHYLICRLARDLAGTDWNQKTGPALLVLLLAIAFVIWYRFPVRNARDVLHAGFWLMTADLCLSTTVHPWYLSWAALALPLFPYAFMFWWTGAAFLSYIAYSYRPVYEPPWVLLLEYLPMYALLTWEIWHRRPLLPWILRKNPEGSHHGAASSQDGESDSLARFSHQDP